MNALNDMRVVIMAGGTGGHVYPALAVAQKLRDAGAKVSWLGTRQGMEARIVPQAGFDVDWIQIGGVRGKGLMTKIIAPMKIVLACTQAAAALLRRRPHVVLGMGGFVTGPGGIMAWMLRKPLVIHEQNSVAGMTNRILARFARTVLEAFPGSFGAGTKTVHTGNPVREEILVVQVPERRSLANKPRVLVVGGSLGAQVLNETVPKALALLPEQQRPEVLHQAGKTTLDIARTSYAEAEVKAEVVEYIEDMARGFVEADLVICRAGALTVSELAAVGVASVLVPLPHAVDDHQTGNARYLSEADAAVLIPQNELSAEVLAGHIANLIGDPDLIFAMATNARAMAKPDATKEVVRHCCEAAGWASTEVWV